jgi:succinate dehydrogenase / fumarate reductase flavoprotein subunit
MQGLADGYFVISYCIGDYLARLPYDKVPVDHEAFKEAENRVKKRISRLLNLKGNKTVDEYHRELGKIMWDYCGMSRTAEGLAQAKKMVAELRHEYWSNVNVLGSGDELNMTLEKALRVADYFELGELMIDDALNRNESCGGHFREEYQTEEGEAARDDENYTYVAAWEYKGMDEAETLHKEALEFENVKLTQRSYK